MKMKIAAAQMGPNSEDISENLQRMISVMQKAADEGVQLLGFPELSLTPFFACIYTKEFIKYTVTLTDQPIMDLQRACRERNIAIAFGYAERENGQYYNSAMIIDKYGKIKLNYRKIHIPSPMISDTMGNYEKTYFSAGSEYPVTEIEGVKIGIQICYDRHFPEGYRVLAYKGAEIIFNLTATVAYNSEWRKNAWKLLLQSRAFENGVFVVGVNKTGAEYGKEYYGNSMIISPLGPKEICFADTLISDDLISAEVDLDDTFEAWRRVPFR